MHTIAGWWFQTFFIFPYIGNNHQNWLFFLRGVESTNQIEIHQWAAMYLVSGFQQRRRMSLCFSAVVLAESMLLGDSHHPQLRVPIINTGIVQWLSNSLLYHDVFSKIHHDFITTKLLHLWSNSVKRNKNTASESRISKFLRHTISPLVRWFRTTSTNSG